MNFFSFKGTILRYMKIDWYMFVQLVRWINVVQAVKRMKSEPVTLGGNHQKTCFY